MREAAEDPEEGRDDYTRLYHAWEKGDVKRVLELLRDRGTPVPEDVAELAISMEGRLKSETVKDFILMSLER